ncbi:MAG: DUF4147 domain-containing protein [Paracoccaceae bacterium]
MTDLRAEARRLFDAAVKAADPRLALRAGFAENPPPRAVNNGSYIVVSVGKAAIPMAEEALAFLAEIDASRPVEAIVVTNYENARDLPGARTFASGHPVPDENGLRAGQAVMALLDRAGADDSVIALISGGGSALLPSPVEGVSLADKAAVNRLLLAHGFEISEINLIRQQLSQLKGGGMLRHAAPARVSAYILSDVIGDDLRAIASGPTVAPIGTAADAVRLLQGKGIWEDLPSSVRRHLTREVAAQPPLPAARNLLVGSNRKSIEAIVKNSIFKDTQVGSDHLTGDVAEACELILEKAAAAATSAASNRPLCLVFDGETTVTLRGTGLGGRNQELALRMALAAPGRLDRPFTFLSGGTDGRDGPTEAAGGLVDNGSAARMRATGVDPEALLANNDSNAALAASGDLLTCGATGTNVADVQILLLGAKA